MSRCSVLRWVCVLIGLTGCDPPDLGHWTGGQKPPVAIRGVTVLSTNTAQRLLAIDHEGTGYALSNANGSARLYASTDGLRTWSERGRLATGRAFRVITVLEDGTLLADISSAAGHVLARSADRGAQWTDVLTLGRMLMLTPHSVAELGGTTFLGEYQAFTNDSVPLRLWASEDSGAHWTLRHTFEGRRHVHGLRADPASGALWVFFGDNEIRTGMERSSDGGRTFVRAIEGSAGSAVNIVVTPAGLLYGQDIVFGATPPALVLVPPDGPPQRLARIPGPSYSIVALRDGGYLIGTTREPGGDVYEPGDESAHLLASDGRTLTELLSYPRAEPGYARADTRWQLPTGEVVLELADVEPVGKGYGFQLLKVER